MARLPPSGMCTSGALQICWLTDAGLERANNEDACAALPEQGLALIADGMGGEAAGELASRRVAEWLPPLLAEQLNRADAADPHAVEPAIEDAIRALNHRVVQEASSLAGVVKMGATLTMLLFLEPCAYVANIGDSRAYLLRDGRLSRLTRDHSVVGTLVERGIITPEQAAGHPMRNQLTRYVGMGGNTGPDISRIRPEAEDVVLLCTDGLTDGVDDDDIRRLVLEADDLTQACRALVDAANRAGGRDNTTVVLLRWAA